MVTAIFGLHLTQPTVLSITGTGGTSAPFPVLTISKRSASSTASRTPAAGAWKVPLSAGDYVVQLDDRVERPVRVSLDPPGVFVSLSRTTPAAITAWPGGVVTNDDPKDPWPPPVVADGGTTMAAAGSAAAAWFNTMLLPLANVISRNGIVHPRIHALLIGIDHYPEAAAPNQTLYRSLGGCVRDVLEVETFLRERLGVPASQITRLLSPLPGSEARGAELPTYDNIVAAWQRLINEVPAGDQVYIHYAGHGGRVKTCVPDVKGPAERDEALVPCNIHDRAAGRYLRDVEVAHLLDQMNRRDQLATIVVDACHAGGLPRRGDAVPRCGIADDLAARPSDALGSAVASRAELEAVARRGGTRGLGDAASVAGASSTVLVAACRQNEYAYEYAFDGQVRRGALTYFWLEALDRRAASLTYRAAQRQIDSAIAAHLTGQSPVVIGDIEREVLGVDHVRPARAIPVLAVEGPRITLRAGMASLVRRGMRLAIAPPDAVAELVELTGLPEVEVIDVAAASSIARRVGDSTGPIVAGAQAIPLRFTDTTTRQVKWQPSGLPGDDDARGAFMAALAADRSKLVAAAPDGTAAHYFVKLTAAEGDPAYSILDASDLPVPRLRPAIRVSDAGAAARVVARIAHLARFSAVQTLDYSDPQSPLTGRLELELLALPDDFQPSDAMKPRPFAERPRSFVEGTWFCLRVHNRSPFDLGTVVLDLQPDWGISKLVPRESAWIQIAPNSFVDTPVRGWLPPGYDAASDTLKAIATIDPTSFDWLCLDPLDPAQARGESRGLPSTRLREVMELMQSATHITRNVDAANVPTRAWTTVQLTINIESHERARSKGTT